MSDFTYAWGGAEEEVGAASRTAVRAGTWGGLLFGLTAAIWMFAYATGLYTTLGWAEGSERHGRNLVRVADDSTIGLSTMYLAAGQRAWWDYDVTVEGRGGVRLRIAKSVPSQAFIVRTQDVAATSRGRFEVIAPESGLYHFSQELIPQGVLFSGGEAGSTRYDLRWGVD